MAYDNPDERAERVLDMNADCGACGHPGYLHDTDGCHDALAERDPDGIPYRCTCPVPARLARAVVECIDRRRYTLTTHGQAHPWANAS